MTIKKGTPIAKRKDPKVDGVYDWDKYGSNYMAFALQIGHHAPTLEQLNAAGWLLKSTDIFNQLTHKLIEPASWQDDGVYITRKNVALTQEEKDLNRIELKSRLVTYTKYEARRRILFIIPEWKQQNCTARAIELQEIRHELGELDYDDAAELLSIREIFTDYVKPIRSASDMIEINIESEGITTEEQINNHVLWP